LKKAIEECLAEREVDIKGKGQDWCGVVWLRSIKTWAAQINLEPWLSHAS